MNRRQLSLCGGLESEKRQRNCVVEHGTYGMFFSGVSFASFVWTPQQTLLTIQPDTFSSMGDFL